VRLILREKGGRIRVVAANDTVKDVSCEVEYGYVSLDGGTADLERCKLKLAALERTECCVFGKGRHDARKGLWIARVVDASDTAPAIFRAVDYRQLETGDPGLSASVMGSKGKTCSVRVRARGYAHGVHLVLPAGAEPSDDYFDLLPGESRDITIVSKRRTAVRAVAVTCVNQKFWPNTG
jgi:beta-mannosidase